MSQHSDDMNSSASPRPATPPGSGAPSAASPSRPGVTGPTAGLSGGCQCGAVRYRLGMKPRKVHYCHCRMCQRAVGNVFASLVPVQKTALSWEGESEPSFYRSSSMATRGFCARCGTPLSFAYDKSEWIAVTTGSLDQPDRVRPEIHYGVESQVPWLRINDDLPRERTDESQLAGIVSYQAGHAPHRG